MLWLACLNLFGVLKGITPRATMRVAPNEPQNDGGFTYEPILVSGSSLGHCAVHVISCQRSQNQLGNLCTAIRCSLCQHGCNSSVETRLARGNCPCDSGQFVGQRARD